MLLLLSIICFLLAVGVRIYPILAYSEFLGSDRDFHFFLIDYLRHNNHKVPVHYERALGPVTLCNYPSFYHILLSYFSSTVVKLVDKYFALLYDTIAGTLAFWVYAEYYAHGWDWGLYLMSLGLFIVSPTLTFIYTGPRAYTLTPRNFSQLLFFFVALCVVLWDFKFFSDPFDFIVAALASVSLITLILSSWFGVQKLFFSVIIYTLFTFDFSYAIYMLIALIWLFVFIPGFTKRTVGGGFSNMKFCHLYLRSIFRNPSFKLFFQYVSEGRVHDAFYFMIIHRDVLAIFKTLDFWAIFVTLFFTSFTFFDGSLSSKISALTLSGAIAFGLTMFPLLKILGEPQRYLEFVYPLIWILFLPILEIPFVMVGAAVVFALYMLINLKYIKDIESWGSSAQKLRDLADVLSGVSDNPENAFLPINTHDARNLYGLCQGKVYCHVFIFGDVKEASPEELDAYVLFPYLHSSRVKPICEKYNINYVICHKPSLNYVFKEFSTVYHFDSFERVKENSSYILYKV